MPCSACTVLVYEPYFVMASQMSWAHPEAASLCYNLQGTGPGTGQRQSVDRIRAERCVYHAGLARTLSAAGTPHSPQHGTHVHGKREADVMQKVSSLIVGIRLLM